LDIDIVVVAAIDTMISILSILKKDPLRGVYSFVPDFFREIPKNHLSSQELSREDERYANHREETPREYDADPE